MYALSVENLGAQSIKAISTSDVIHELDEAIQGLSIGVGYGVVEIRENFRAPPIHGRRERLKCPGDIGCYMSLPIDERRLRSQSGRLLPYP